MSIRTRWVSDHAVSSCVTNSGVRCFLVGGSFAHRRAIGSAAPQKGPADAVRPSHTRTSMPRSSSRGRIPAPETKAPTVELWIPRRLLKHKECELRAMTTWGRLVEPGSEGYSLLQRHRRWQRVGRSGGRGGDAADWPGPADLKTLGLLAPGASGKSGSGRLRSPEKSTSADRAFFASDGISWSAKNSPKGNAARRSGNILKLWFAVDPRGVTSGDVFASKTRPTRHWLTDSDQACWCVVQEYPCSGCLFTFLVNYCR